MILFFLSFIPNFKVSIIFPPSFQERETWVGVSLDESMTLFSELGSYQKYTLICILLQNQGWKSHIQWM